MYSPEAHHLPQRLAYRFLSSISLLASLAAPGACCRHLSLPVLLLPYLTHCNLWACRAVILRLGKSPSN